MENNFHKLCRIRACCLHHLAHVLVYANGVRFGGSTFGLFYPGYFLRLSVGGEGRFLNEMYLKTSGGGIFPQSRRRTRTSHLINQLSPFFFSGVFQEGGREEKSPTPKANFASPGSVCSTSSLNTHTTLVDTHAREERERETDRHLHCLGAMEEEEEGERRSF